ncbi:MAG TPA: hypothetical protein VEC58_01900 [Roseiarcus sp.]|jgi:hypothetical protein|nr:hypothetical protein [Roseiarcus sp.]
MDGLAERRPIASIDNSSRLGQTVIGAERFVLGPQRVTDLLFGG